MEKNEIIRWLREYDGRPVKIMEVCGTHTSALYKTGLRQILSPKIQLLSGPGCPVCVTPTAYIDKLVEISFRSGHRVLAFGDMLAVPGTEMSLAEARDRGASVDFFYNPEDALKKAEGEKETIFVLAAVGFETTAPIWATVVKEADERHISNLKLLTALKTMPETLGELCTAGNIDGFLCPGHVAVITGAERYRALSETYGKPMVIGGFTADLLLSAVARLVLAVNKGQGGFWNDYGSVVTEKGNVKAWERVEAFFEKGDALWRGLGIVKNSGFYLKEKYNLYDAGSRGLVEDHIPAGCRCGNILLGKNMPKDCPHSGEPVRLPILSVRAWFPQKGRAALPCGKKGWRDCENYVKAWKRRRGKRKADQRHFRFRF